jgi:hypothetical protein
MLTPKADGTYTSFSDYTKLFFSGGDHLDFSTSGGDVPSFSIGFFAPSLVTLVAPPSSHGDLSINVGQDLEFVWTGGGFGQTNVTFAVADSVSSTTIDCAALSQAGTLTVPAAAFAFLPPHPAESGFWGLRTTTSAQNNVGTFEVRAHAHAVGAGTDGFLASGTLLY